MPTSTPRKGAAKKTTARAGNPATRAAPVASAGDFKKKTAPAELVLPSGLKVLVRRVGIVTLMNEKLFSDQLMAIVAKAIDTNTGSPGVKDADLAQLAADPEKIGQLMEAFDKITIRCWVTPQVHPVPESDDERDDDLLYVDEIDLEDKARTFDFAVGGDADLARFREQSEQSLGRLPAGADVEGTAV